MHVVCATLLTTKCTLGPEHLLDAECQAWDLIEMKNELQSHSMASLYVHIIPPRGTNPKWQVRQKLNSQTVQPCTAAAVGVLCVSKVSMCILRQHACIRHVPVGMSIVQYSTVQYSTVQYSTEGE